MSGKCGPFSNRNNMGRRKLKILPIELDTDGVHISHVVLEGTKGGSAYKTPHLNFDLLRDEMRQCYDILACGDRNSHRGIPGDSFSVEGDAMKPRPWTSLVIMALFMLALLIRFPFEMLTAMGISSLVVGLMIRRTKVT